MSKLKYKEDADKYDILIDITNKYNIKHDTKIIRIINDIVHRMSLNKSIQAFMNAKSETGAIQALNRIYRLRRTPTTIPKRLVFRWINCYCMARGLPRNSSVWALAGRGVNFNAIDIEVMTKYNPFTDESDELKELLISNKLLSDKTLMEMGYDC